MTPPAPTPRAQAEKPLHSPLPWQVGSSNEVFSFGEDESFSEWLNIKDADGKVICELPGHSQYARETPLAAIENANADLIVESVNAAPALQAQNARLRAELENTAAALESIPVAVDSPYWGFRERQVAAARQAISTTQEFNAPQEDAKP